MNEDERMFHIGLIAAIAVLMLTAVLQVCYRTQNKARVRVRNEIVRTQQESADLRTKFASYVRPEVLRNMVMALYPKSETINFTKTARIDDLAIRTNPE
jgi:(p)ppGpp synthase/HD superfamily hydrolase